MDTINCYGLSNITMSQYKGMGLDILALTENAWMVRRQKRNILRIRLRKSSVV